MTAARMLMISLVIPAFFATTQARAAVARVERVGVGPSIKVTRAGKTLQLRKDDELDAGDEVTTDAQTAVDLRLEDETLIRVGVNSSYKVVEDSKLKVLVHRLLSGVVRVLVKPNDKDHKDPTIKFRMATPEGTIGVRGTEFVVIRTSGNTQLKGLDGEVLFGPADADFGADAKSFVLVQRGFQSSIVGGASAPKKLEKFDTRKYLDEINGEKSALFGPLSGKASSSAVRYARGAKAPDPAPTGLGGGSSGPGPAKPDANSEDKGAPPAKAQQIDRRVQLLQSAQTGDLKKAREALDNGADPNSVIQESDGHTALEIAMLEGRDDVFRLLIERAADVDRPNKDGRTPLMFVAQHKLAMKYVTALISQGGADPLVQDKAGNTVEDYAKRAEYGELVAYLNSKNLDDDVREGSIQMKKIQKLEAERREAAAQKALKALSASKSAKPAAKKDEDEDD